MSDMNNNVKDNKKNLFKRLSSFKKFLIIYASALIVIIAAALVIYMVFLRIMSQDVRLIRWIRLLPILKGKCRRVD